MSENIAQTVQKAIQDLVAPDVRELKTNVAALQKQIDQRFDSLTKQIDQRFEAQDRVAALQSDKSDAQFKAIIALLGEFKAQFGEFKAQSELTYMRTVSQLSERVAILEANR